MEAWRQYRAFTPVEIHPLSLRRSAPTPAAIPPVGDTDVTPDPPLDPLTASEMVEDVDRPNPPKHQPEHPAHTQPGRSKDMDKLDGSTPPPSSPNPVYVSFEADDPANPQNWSMKYKIFVVCQVSFLTIVPTFASSASSSAEIGLQREFGSNVVVATATTGAFLAGMGIGAMPTAPLSECQCFARLPPTWSCGDVLMT